MLASQEELLTFGEQGMMWGQAGQPVGVVPNGLAGNSPSKDSSWRLDYLGEAWERDARVNEV